MLLHIKTIQTGQISVHYIGAKRRKINLDSLTQYNSFNLNQKCLLVISLKKINKKKNKV